MLKIFQITRKRRNYQINHRFFSFSLPSPRLKFFLFLFFFFKFFFFFSKLNDVTSVEKLKQVEKRIPHSSPHSFYVFFSLFLDPFFFFLFSIFRNLLKQSLKFGEFIIKIKLIVMDFLYHRVNIRLYYHVLRPG